MFLCITYNAICAFCTIVFNSFFIVQLNECASCTIFINNVENFCAFRRLANHSWLAVPPACTVLRIFFLDSCFFKSSLRNPKMHQLLARPGHARLYDHKAAWLVFLLTRLYKDGFDF